MNARTTIALAAIGAGLAIAVTAYNRGYTLGSALGYWHGEIDGIRQGRRDAEALHAAGQPSVNEMADALIRDLTGSASFAEALMDAELREGLHEGAAERWLAEPRSPAFWGDEAHGGAA